MVGSSVRDMQLNRPPNSFGLDANLSITIYCLLLDRTKCSTSSSSECLSSWIGSVRAPPGLSACRGCRGRRVHGDDYRGEHDVAFVPSFSRVNSVSGRKRRKISFLFSLPSTKYYNII